MVPKDEAGAEAFRAILWDPETIAAFLVREMADHSIMRHILDAHRAPPSGNIQYVGREYGKTARAASQGLESTADGQLEYAAGLEIGYRVGRWQLGRRP